MSNYALTRMRPAEADLLNGLSYGRNYGQLKIEIGSRKMILCLWSRLTFEVSGSDALGHSEGKLGLDRAEGSFRPTHITQRSRLVVTSDLSGVLQNK